MHTRPGLVELSLDIDRRCPSCRDAFRAGEPIVVCPQCQTVVHGLCLGKDGRCTTFGCANGAPVPPLPRSRRRRVVSLAAMLVLGGAVGALAVHSRPPPPRPVVVTPTPCPAPAPLPPTYVVWQLPERALPPGPPPAAGPAVFLTVPTVVTSADVVISGTINGAGPLRVTVVAPGGHSIAWDAFEPGRFATAVTLPRRGRHTVDVIVRDANGGRTVTEYSVLWR